MTSESTNRSAPASPARSILVIVMRGVIVSVFALLTVVGLAATWGAVFGYRASATIYGGNAPPGVDGATANALIFGVFAGPPVAAVAFFVGVIWALVARPKKT